MLLDPQRSLVLLVDVQEKLTPLVQSHGTLVSNCQWLLEIASLMEVPIIVSEQYPQGLGSTVKSLQPFIQSDNYAAKTHFSCAADPGCWDLIDKTDRTQIILIGIETHVCVLQTALGLQERSKHVFVVADATASRTAEDKKLALQRMRQQGVEITSREMVVFEWLRRSDNALFKTISKKYLR